MLNPYNRTHEKGEYIDSYYSRTLNVEKEFPILEEEIKVPVCIIGGGMAGVAVATSLVEKGVKPALIESHRIGFGASGRNGGFVSPGYSTDIDSVAHKVGSSQAKELYGLTIDAMDIIRRRMGDRKEEFTRGKEGLLKVSYFNEREKVENKVTYLNNIMGDDLEFWSREKMRDNYLTNKYYDGYLEKNAFQVHSLNYTCHSAKLAEDGGAKIYEKSPVKEIVKHGDGWKVITEKGAVVADQIVVSCSAYIGNLNFKLSNATLPVATYILLTEPLGDRLETAIRGEYGVSDNRFSSNYYRVVEDKRIFWGGRVSMFNPTGDKLVNIMMDDMLHIYPQLKGVKAEVAWGGFMGYPVHKMPQIGQLEPGFWYCQGFGGSGMTSTIAGGEVVSSAIASGDEKYKLFEPFGLTYAGKPFGPIVAQSAYWLFQLQDAFKAWRLNKD